MGDVVYKKHMISRSSFVSQEPLRLHFGFAETDRIDTITVMWPDGTRKVLTDVAPGQVLRINSGDLNADDQIDIHDISLLASALASPETPLPSSMFPRADIDLDGVVDLTDLAALMDKVLSQYR